MCGAIWAATDADGAAEFPPPQGIIDFELLPGTPNTGQFGNQFGESADPDGIVSASFTATLNDLELSLTGFDIDFETEVEVRLNGNSLGFLSVGPNNAENAGDTFTIAAGSQIEGTNLITFAQTISPAYKWGVTDLLLSEIIPSDLMLAAGNSRHWPIWQPIRRYHRCGRYHHRQFRRVRKRPATRTDRL